MFKQELYPETQIDFRGMLMTVEEFAEEHCNNDIQMAAATIEVLIKKGSVKILLDRKTEQQKAIEKAAKEQVVTELANNLDSNEREAKFKKAERARENRLVYEEIEIAYNSPSQAIEAEAYYIEELCLRDTEIKIKDGQAFLVVRNISEKELNFINRTYTADRVISGAVNVVDTGMQRTTQAVDYTAKKVLSPMLGIGAKAGASIAKSLFGVVARTGATVVRTVSEGAKQTAHELKYDPEIIRAGRELIDAKDGVVRNVKKIGGAGTTGSGIRIVK